MIFIYTVAIIGAGAAGLMAANSAVMYLKENSIKGKIILLEKNDRVGKKILATGNGRCNLGASKISLEDYYISGESPVSLVLNQFTPEKEKEVFKNLGLLIKEDDFGRRYPNSLMAASVLDTLRLNLGHDVEIKTFFCAEKIIKKERGYEILSGERSVLADKIIFAFGGKAAKGFGTDGESFKMFSGFLPRPEKLTPALCPVKINFKYLKELAGVRAKAKVVLKEKDKEIFSQEGEVQFNKLNISGIVIMNLSRLVKNDTDFKLHIDFAPNLLRKEIYENIKIRLSVADEMPYLLGGILNKKLGAVLIKNAVGKKKISELCEKDIDLIINNIKEFNVSVLKPDDYLSSQVTCGGIKKEDIFFKTMNLKNNKDFFAVGEMIDVDGMCGGYNLHFAWASGYVAGQNVFKD